MRRAAPAALALALAGLLGTPATARAQAPSPDAGVSDGGALQPEDGHPEDGHPEDGHPEDGHPADGGGPAGDDPRPNTAPGDEGEGPTGEEPTDPDPEGPKHDQDRVDLDELDPDVFVVTEEELEAADSGEAPSADEATNEAEDGPPGAGTPGGAGGPVAAPDRTEEDDEELYRLREVVVTHSREDLFRTGGAVQTVDEETLETYELDDPHDVVLQVPGVYVRQEDGYGLRPNIGLRGASSERSKKVSLMEDGVLLAPAPYSAPAAYYFPVVTRMVGVEVFKGPSAIMYGPHTVGGAINWTTRRLPHPGEQTGAIDLALGTDVYGKLHGYYGIYGERVGVLLEGVHLQSDGFKELDGGGNTGFNRQELMLKLGANSDPAERLYHQAVLKLGFARENSNETYLGLTDADFRASPNRRYAASQLGDMDWHRLQAELQHVLQVGESFDLVTTGYRHSFSRSWRKLNRFRNGPALADVLASPDSGVRRVFYDVLTGTADSASDDEALMVGTNARDFVSQGIQSRARLRFGEGPLSHQLEGGLRFHHDEIERRHTEDGYLMKDGRLAPDERDTAVTTRNRGSARALAAHVMYGLTWKGLTVRPGLRTELVWTELLDHLTPDETGGFQWVVLPGLGVHYAFTEELGVIAGVHQGFSPVSPGQPDAVEPEKSLNYELGGRFASGSSRVELIGFFNDYENLLGECRFSLGCTESMVDRQFNAGEVHVYGLEVVAGHAFELGRGLSLPGHLSYTFTETEFQTSFVSDNPQFGEVNEGDELPYVPHHQAALRLGLEHGDDWGIHLSATYVGVMREAAGPALPYGAFGLGRDEDDAPPGELTDDYVIVDLVGSLRVFEGASVYLKVDNLFNTHAIVARRPFGARPTAPLLAQLGFEYQL